MPTPLVLYLPVRKQQLSRRQATTPSRRTRRQHGNAMQRNMTRMRLCILTPAILPRTADALPLRRHNTGTRAFTAWMVAAAFFVATTNARRCMTRSDLDSNSAQQHLARLPRLLGLWRATLPTVRDTRWHACTRALAYAQPFSSFCMRGTTATQFATRIQRMCNAACVPQMLLYAVAVVNAYCARLKRGGRLRAHRGACRCMGIYAAVTRIYAPHHHAYAPRAYTLRTLLHLRHTPAPLPRAWRSRRCWIMDADRIASDPLRWIWFSPHAASHTPTPTAATPLPIPPPPPGCTHHPTTFWRAAAALHCCCHRLDAFTYAHPTRRTHAPLHPHPTHYLPPPTYLHYRTTLRGCARYGSTDADSSHAFTARAAPIARLLPRTPRTCRDGGRDFMHTPLHFTLHTLHTLLAVPTMPLPDMPACHAAACLNLCLRVCSDIAQSRIYTSCNAACRHTYAAAPSRDIAALALATVQPYRYATTYATYPTHTLHTTHHHYTLYAPAWLAVLCRSRTAGRAAAS